MKPPTPEALATVRALVAPELNDVIREALRDPQTSRTRKTIANESLATLEPDDLVWWGCVLRAQGRDSVMRLSEPEPIPPEPDYAELATEADWRFLACADPEILALAIERGGNLPALRVLHTQRVHYGIVLRRLIDLNALGEPLRQSWDRYATNADDASGAREAAFRAEVKAAKAPIDPRAGVTLIRTRADSSAEAVYDGMIDSLVACTRFAADRARDVAAVAYGPLRPMLPAPAGWEPAAPAVLAEDWTHAAPLLAAVRLGAHVERLKTDRESNETARKRERGDRRSYKPLIDPRGGRRRLPPSNPLDDPERSP